MNQGKFLTQNILSVLNQNYSKFQHIVVDGLSHDETIDILKSYPHIDWISKEDDGQSEAINNGFRMSDGDIIGWLNSDDYYLPETFPKIIEFFKQNDNVDFVFSNCLIVNENDQIIGFRKGKDPKRYPVSLNRNYIPQPTVFFKKIIFETVGYLDEKYKMSMDFDYWRRISKNHTMVYLNDIFACFRIHNTSKTERYSKEFKKESKESFFKNGGSVFSPYYYETFLQPKLQKLFFDNCFIRRIFYR